MRNIACLLCLFWLTSVSQAQGTYTLDQVFAKMDEVAKTFRSAQTDIERTHVTILVNDKDVSSGKFYYVRKGKLQIYTPNLKQVQEASLGEHQDKVEMFMALGFGQSSQDLKKNFTVSVAGDEVVDGKKTTVLELQPKNSSMFRSVQ